MNTSSDKVANRRNKSIVWLCFTKIKKEDQVYGKCNHCTNPPVQYVLNKSGK